MSLRPDDAYFIYTDGSCWAKDRIGAWAWVIVDGDHNEVLNGGSDLDTTISRMELLGPIDALEWLHEHYGRSVVCVYSDSEYVVKGIMDRTRSRKSNVDLWLWLDEIVDAHEYVYFEHVRGHMGDHYNEMVDKYAGELRQGARLAAQNELLSATQSL